MWLVAGVVGWAAIAVAGSAFFLRYEMTATDKPPSIARWPADTVLPHRAGIPTVLLFAHPRCPCTRASLAEFVALLERLPRDVDASVVFIQPHDAPTEWRDGDLHQRARTLAVAIHEVDGIEAARFGVSSSGHLVIYDGNGELRFSGGITASRGHVGDNLGLATAIAALQRTDSPGHAPVFGCDLEDRR